MCAEPTHKTTRGMVEGAIASRTRKNLKLMAKHILFQSFIYYYLFIYTFVLIWYGKSFHISVAFIA